jgi:signal transduction histidine kinase
MVDLSSLMRDAVALLAPMVAAKRLSLVLDLPEQPILFPTDSGKFRQIVFNLAANAVKFTKAGEVRLRLLEEQGTLFLRVSDTGIGISPDDAERLFESFWQVRQSGQQYPAGTGLGLSITRQLAQLLGGDVSVESQPGQGSTFIVRLPRPAVEHALGTSAASMHAPRRERRRHRERDVAKVASATTASSPKPPLDD